MAGKTFLGLQPYTEDDAYRFKGRTEESQELFRIIVRNDCTVCYAESGEGKTSLLNAGVFPLLKENMYFPIAITFTSDDYKTTPDSFSTIINRCIKDSITEYNEKNKGINVEYRLCSTDFQGLDCQAELQRELSEYSWWKLRNYKPQAIGLTFTPVFVFDQFEEVFNMPGSIVWTKKFFDWLEEVSSDSCPDEITKKVRKIIGINATFPIIKEEKDFKAVFSLRKEFIGELDYWGTQKCFIPSLKDNRYCLKALTYAGAKKVMTQQERFEEDKVEQVLTYFVNQYSKEPEKTINEGLPVIPALLLSVVCDSWEKDMDGFAKLSTAEIGQSLNSAIEAFYNRALDTIVQELSGKDPNIIPEKYHLDLETTIFALIDGNGKRVRTKTTNPSLTQIDFNVKYKQVLSKHRIIKVSKIDGEDYVEIVHDSLCAIIAKRKILAETKEREELLLIEQEKIRKALQEKYLQYKRTTLRVFLVFLGIIALVLFDYSLSHVTKPRTITDPINAESFGRRIIFHESHTENGELFIHGRYTTIWGDMNLKKIVFTDTTFASKGKFIAPKLEEVLFRKGIFVLSTQTFSNAPHIVTIMDSVQCIYNNGTICFSTKPIEYNIGKNESFKILHSDILISKDHEDNEWDIIFAGNQDKSSPIVIPYNIKLSDRHTNLNIIIAKQIELDRINHEKLSDEEYYYLVNTNSKDTITTTYLNFFGNLTYANITDTKIIKRFSLYNVKEATFPHAKELWYIKCPKLRRLELPNIEKIESNAVDCETLAELFLPTRLCTSKDTLQQNLFRWGIGKLITQIIPQNDSTSLVRLDNTFLISPETEFPNDTLLNCPYDKVKLRIPSHINNIASNAFDGATYLEDLSVDIDNKEYFSYGNAVYQHGEYIVKGYAPNASEIYLLNWDINKTLRLGDNVRKIYTFFPETMYNNNIIGNCLNNVTLYVPKPKLKAATITLGNVFGEIKPLNTYQILFIDLSFIIKLLFCEYHILLTVAFIMLSSALLFRKTRQYALCLCIVYPFCFICHHVAHMILGFRQYNTGILLYLALVITFLIVEMRKRKLLNKTKTELD